MGDIRIEVGASEGMMWIGIEPPLTDEQEELLRQAEFVNSDVRLTFSNENPEGSLPYSRKGIPADTFKSSGEGDKGILGVAQAISRVLERGGDMVVVDQSLHRTEEGQFVFIDRAS